MRRRINLDGVDFSPKLQNEIDTHVSDIAEFCPENCTISVTVEKLLKNNHTFEVRMELIGPRTKMFASTKERNMFHALSETKRKILKQFVSHRKQNILNRRKEKYRYNREAKFKEVA